MPGRLHDGHGRRFEYLRLSLTDVCNFRCSYCLPDGYRKVDGQSANLSVDEIRRLVTAFARLGLWKVRLTGGEPSLRRELLEIARTVAAVPGISKLAMTTNGYRLAERAADYARAGITALNISADSLVPERFAAITGHDRLGEVLDGIAAARAAGIASVKLNSVLMRGVNDDELDSFSAFVTEHDLSLRFIEVMRTNDNPGFFDQHHLAGVAITEKLEQAGWRRLPRETGAGPAIDYASPYGRGRIGIIAPYSRDFCASCNRLRVSAKGKLHLCLFGDFGIDLRPLLQHDTQLEELTDRITALTATKAPEHRLHQGNSGTTPHLASIGG
ncbi:MULTISPECIES: GTP 3',8-cyclase MoaA [unclassified Novosphingobium]|uniref:GTP 3',8-cyclase MoaA n=1 Tax=unclassified Novosphingobium TaxID=2644732 RepID=UPI0025CE1401|nr:MULTISPECIES: GTP 3',8-cyclase MoaA [unclassified Novosphingobium]HQV03949.1 GTP 3',8-cyclase MoaA [Novosphingobium sp.]